MKLEDQVVSLELARKLKELGVVQTSIFGWTSFNDGTADLDFRYDGNLIPPTECAAFTASEILDLMPGRNKYWDIEGKWSNDWWLRVDQSWGAINDPKPDGSMQNTWSVNYYSDMDTHKLINQDSFSKNLADETAKVLIYLIENKLINLN